MDRTEIDAPQHRADQALLRGHPVDALEAIAQRAGREVDPTHAAEMRALCDEVVSAPRKGDWMQTYGGRQYWPLDPRPADVCVTDIAHHLSMLCRYCGACRSFYSVAEHSTGVLHVARQAARREAKRDRGEWERFVARHALMHDAPEAYCHDLIRPIKRCVAGYAEVERLNEQAIGVALGLPPMTEDVARLVKDADNAMLLAEQELLMAPAPAKWAAIDVPEAMTIDARRWLLRMGGATMAPGQAKAAFLAAWDQLQ